MTDVLTPPLTKYDKRVLALLPKVNLRDVPTRTDLLSAHQVAELLGTDDVQETRRILAGLVKLNHAESAESRSRKVKVYWRDA
jgi:hypothetical protein